MQIKTKRISAPFKSAFRIHSMDDVRRLESVPLEQALTVSSTYEIFCNSAQAFGDKIALTFLRSGKPEDSPIQWSFAQLLAGIHQTANLLHRLGITPDDAVAILLPGCLEYHLALWGGEAAGIVQPLNPMLSDEKLVSLINTSRAKILIAYGSDRESEIWSKAMRISKLSPTMTHVLRVAPHDENPEYADSHPLQQAVLDFNANRAAERDDCLVSGRDIMPDDIAAYFHTGGTTGSPKLAMHRHGAQVFSAWASVQLMDVRPGDVTINGYPLFHVAGVLPTSLAALSSGIETVIPTAALFRNREMLANYWRLAERYTATTLSAVPTVLAALTNVPVLEANIASIRQFRTGASPLPPELAARFKRLFGLHVYESFGMTETAGISSITPFEVESPAGCVGFRLPYSQIRIVATDKSGQPTETEVSPGEHGMVLIKSPNLFSGFLDAHDNVNAFTADGWLVTGDLGRLDERERLHLTGRSKDLIIRGGHNIDPKAIEDALTTHPAVQVCAAVGMPDVYAGELPVAFVTLVPGATVSEAALLAYAALHVDEAPARPKWISIINVMPMTSVGKIYKPELRLLAAKLAVDALIAGICDPTRIAQVTATAQDGISIILSNTATALDFEKLHEALVPYPFKTTLLQK